MTARLTAWLMDLSRRERTLLAAAGALTIGVVVLAGFGAMLFEDRRRWPLAAMKRSAGKGT